MKYNNFSSVCDTCGGNGWFEKHCDCTRKISIPCAYCGSYEEAELMECTGKNVLIDYSDISKQFIPYYENGSRIKVKFSYGEIKSGTIGKTTGWKPVFILMLTSRSTGSSYVLTDKEKIVY
jgi:hypothetical protein